MRSLLGLDGQAWRLVLTAGMASYLDAGALVVSGLAIGGFYTDAFALGPLRVGLLLGAQTVGFAVGALLGGRLGDLLGRRDVLLACLSAYAASMALLAGAWGVAPLAVGMAMSGLAIGGDLPSSLALISEQARPGMKARLIAVTQALWIGGIASAGLLGLLMSDLGVLAARLMYACLLVIALLVLAFRFTLTESREWITARKTEPSGTAARQFSHASGEARWEPRSVWPVALALGLFYAAWNLGANTLGQFRPYIWIEVLGGSPAGASTLILGALPVGVVGVLLFARVADGPSRQRWVIVGSLTSLAGWLLMAIVPGRLAFVALCLLFVLGASCSGEVAYKIWSQQLVPTLSRATVQGATLAVARTLAAVVGIVTPLMVNHDPRMLFGAMTVASAFSLAIATVWIPRLPRPTGAGE